MTKLVIFAIINAPSEIKTTHGEPQRNGITGTLSANGTNGSGITVTISEDGLETGGVIWAGVVTGIIAPTGKGGNKWEEIDHSDMDDRIGPERGKSHGLGNKIDYEALFRGPRMAPNRCILG